MGVLLEMVELADLVVEVLVRVVELLEMRVLQIQVGVGALAQVGRALTVVQAAPAS